MPAELEYRMWRQLKGAFNVDRLVLTPQVPDFNRGIIDQYATMEEALASCQGHRVFLEPQGSDDLHDIPWHKDDIVLVLGSTEHGNLHLVRPDDYQVQIQYPGPSDLYGINAAAIALAFRWNS